MGSVSLGKSWLIFITATAFIALLITVTLGAPHEDAPLDKPLIRPTATAAPGAPDIRSPSEHPLGSNGVPSASPAKQSAPGQRFRRLIDNPRDATWAGWQSLSPEDLDLLEREGVVDRRQRKKLEQLDREVRKRGSVRSKTQWRTH